MNIKIFRGTHEIGGTCINLTSESTSILLDIGSPLSSENLNTDYIEAHFDAVIISHSHQDHYGLLEKVSAEIPIYINKLQLDLINAARLFRGLDPLKNNFKFYGVAEPFTIGGFTLHPYLVDHSAANAFAFLIECEGKRIYYSGDFRAHGRKSELFEKHLKTPELKNCDIMFLEGTMIDRDNKDYPSEENVEFRTTELLKSHEGIAFLVSSAQNIDRITSAFKACRDSGRVLVVDLYTAWVLSKVAEISETFRDYVNENICVVSEGQLVGGQYKQMKETPETFKNFNKKIFSKKTLKFEDIKQKPNKYLLFIRLYALKFIDQFINPLVIYSQWNGYLDRPEYANENKFAVDIREKLKDKWVYAHTSGHATVEDLKRFIEALKPKMIVPIHTENPEKFKEEFKDITNIKLLIDNQTIKL